MKNITVTSLLIISLSLSSLAQEKWVHYTKDDGLASNWTRTIIEDNQGNIWVGTDRGLNSITGSGINSYTKKDGLPENIIRNLYLDSSGIIWVYTEKGYARFDGKEISSLVNDNSSDIIYRIIVKRDGKVWIGGSFRDMNLGFILKDYDGKAIEPITQLAGKDIPPVNYLFPESDEDIWIITNDTRGDFISHYDGKSLKSYGEKDGLPSRTSDRLIKTCYKDTKGNYWFGAMEAGIYGSLMRFDGSAWTTFTGKYELAGKAVGWIDEDHEGNIWVMTNKGVNLFNGTEWKQFTDQDILPSEYVQELKMDSKGQVWIGTAKGLLRYNRGNWKTITSGDGLADDNIKAVFEDSRGNIWVGAASNFKKGGVTVFDGEKWHSFDLPDFTTMEIFEDSPGNIWILTERNGVFMYKF